MQAEAQFRFTSARSETIFGIAAPSPRETSHPPPPLAPGTHATARNDTGLPMVGPEPCGAAQGSTGTCGCPMFWMDAYQRLHCCHCRPAPSPAMVRRRWLVVGSPGQFEWVDADLDEGELVAAGRGLRRWASVPPWEQAGPAGDGAGEGKLVEELIGLPHAVEEFLLKVAARASPAPVADRVASEAVPKAEESAAPMVVEAESKAAPVAPVVDAAPEVAAAPSAVDAVVSIVAGSVASDKPPDREIAPAVAPLTVKGESKAKRAKAAAKRPPTKRKARDATQSFLSESGE